MVVNKSKTRNRRSLKPKISLRSAPGSVPGTVNIAENAVAPKIQVISYDRDQIVDEFIDDPARIPEFLGKWPVTWVNVSGLGDASIIEELARIFSIHPLALEDVVNTYQRPKVDPYDNHVFCVLRVPTPEGEQLTAQLSLFVGSNFVLTFQERPAHYFDLIRGRIHHPHSQMRRETQPDYLAYRLVDAAVDAYFPLLEGIGDRLDDLDDVSTNEGDFSIGELNRIKRTLLMYKRAVWPLREAIGELRTDVTPFIGDGTRMFLRDCFDHVAQLIDLLDSYRDICSDLRDYHMASVSNRMNEIMKVLTIISTIFIPLSFIAGLYGMNFDSNDSPYNMPELHWKMGYPMALLLMSCIAGTMLYFFKRRGWIGAKD